MTITGRKGSQPPIQNIRISTPLAKEIIGKARQIEQKKKKPNIDFKDIERRMLDYYA